MHSALGYRSLVNTFLSRFYFAFNFDYDFSTSLVLQAMITENPDDAKVTFERIEKVNMIVIFWVNF